MTQKLNLIIFHILNSEDRVTGFQGGNGGGAGGAGPGTTGFGVSVPFLGAGPQLQLSSKSTESRHAATCVCVWWGEDCSKEYKLQRIEITKE